jgi:hypothetical protein
MDRGTADSASSRAISQCEDSSNSDYFLLGNETLTKHFHALLALC